MSNTVISPSLLVWKFCGKAQFPRSFGPIAQNYAEAVNFYKISTPENWVKLRYFTQWILNTFQANVNFLYPLKRWVKQFDFWSHWAFRHMNWAQESLLKDNYEHFLLQKLWHPYKITKFHLISWCEKFIETYSFAEFRKLCKNYAFPQNFHTRK